jgi:hypothetical protein
MAHATQSDPASLFRLLRCLASVGVLSQVEKRSFALTRLGQALRSHVPGSLKATVITLGEVHYQACGSLLHTVRTGSPAFKHVFGASLFDYLQQDKDAADAFNGGMTDLSALVAHAVALAYDFSRISSIIDVGGGQGALVRKILELNPAITGSIYDLPEAFAESKVNGSDAQRCSFIAGNFFNSVPKDAGAYLLCSVLHDWSDELAAVILRNCRHAMPENAKVLIVEMIVPETNSASFSKLLDVNMMVMTGGRERTKSEFQALLDAAGLRLTRIIPTMAPQSIIEAVKK